MKKISIKLLMIPSILLLIMVILTGCKYRWLIPLGEIEIENLAFNQGISQDYNFQWSSPENEYLRALFEEFELENIVRDHETELDKIMAVTEWTQNLWSHDGNNEPEQNDPISIYREANEQNRNFRCVEYSIVLNGSLNALGFPSRVLSLKTQDVETREYGAGHVVTETYSREFDRWIFIDPQWSAIPVLNNVPLNAVEFQEALANNRDDLEVLGFSNRRKVRYFNWIGEYLYYFDTTLNQRYVNNKSPQRLMLVPVGAEEPKVFQQNHPITNMYFTSSIDEFYPNPKIHETEL